MNEEFGITRVDIQNVESQFEVVFPEQLTDFLLVYNGAEMFLSEIYVNEKRYEVASLVPIKHGKLPVEKVMEWDMADGFVESGLVPIASDRGGNLFYVNTRNGEVILYYSDDFENPKLICGSFQEFIERISVIAS